MTDVTNYCVECVERERREREQAEEIDRLKAEVERMRNALQEIAKGEGRYSRDPITHADNCIEDMKKLAADALETTSNSSGETK